jgi:hypothetical protein
MNTKLGQEERQSVSVMESSQQNLGNVCGEEHDS